MSDEPQPPAAADAPAAAGADGAADATEQASPIELGPEVETTDGGFARKYPPLAAMLVAFLVLLLVMPSALNVPQSNPQETLEYAPIPPEDDTPPVEEGNVSSLGLGESQSLSEDNPEDGGGTPPPPPPPQPPGQGVDRNFRCVGQPPRQTEDPLAPPCVPFFDGENGGATYQGVTDNEIRLLVYFDGGINHIRGSDATNRVSPTAEYFDLFSEPDDDEHFTVKALRVWQSYFNARFQTYGRRVHFFVYFGDCSGGAGCTSEDRRADAADNISKVEPFAVVSFATEGSEDDYLKSMARKGVLNFGSFGLRPAAFFNQFPKLIWSYLPSVEQQAEQYTTYICTQVIGRPVSMASPELNGQPRVLGMIHTDDPKHEGLRQMAALVKEKVEACGGEIVITGTFPQCCLAQDNGEPPTYAQQQMAEFRSLGVTTILWPGGINGNYGKTANANGYVPEWVLLGDGTMDGNYPIRLSQNSAAFDRHAVMVTPQILEPGMQQQRCFQAYNEIDQGSTPFTDLFYTCKYYTNLFQFFVGVQVAGPRLGPTSVDKGFHAIPQRQTGEPTIPACFYLPGDYTCVKDAQVEYWDAAGRAPGDDQPGCWRAIRGENGVPGTRYLPGEWPARNIHELITGDEPCNGYTTSVRFNLQ